MENQYNKTITACFVGYIVQAVVNNFTPLLFLFFQKSYHIPLSQITLLVTFNFGIQLLVDLLSVGFIDKIGYRASMIIAHVLSAAGLILLTVLPEILPVPDEDSDKISDEPPVSAVSNAASLIPASPEAASAEVFSSPDTVPAAGVFPVSPALPQAQSCTAIKTDNAAFPKRFIY